MEEVWAIFGNPAIWDATFLENEKVFRSIENLRTVARELVVETKKSAQELVQVFSALTHLCSESAFDVLLLAGNKRGAGAMKVARGMFEISLTASYLEKNPLEINDYVSFSLIEAWRHLQAVEKYGPGKVPPELMKGAEDEYNRVKSQFSNARGQVRFRWSAKSLRQMAEEVGLLNIYEIAYSPASELHHMPFTGIIGHGLDWLRESLRVAHGSLLGTTISLYNADSTIEVDFMDRMKAAISDFGSKPAQP